MNPPITGFWAKLARDDDRNLIGWHPLISHCADVAACFELLLSETILGRRLAATIGADSLSSQTRARLAYLAALHDAGKVNLGFQRKAFSPSVIPGKRAGHLSPLIDVIDSYDDLKEAILLSLKVDDVCDWFDDENQTIDMLVTTWGHHGRPVTIGTDFDHDLWVSGKIAGQALDPVEGLEALANAAKIWFPEAFEQGGPALQTTPAFQHLYIGILTLADWMGSDSRFFSFEEGDPIDRFEWAVDVARALGRASGLLPQPARDTLGPQPPGFERINPAYQPRPLQRACLDLDVCHGGELLVLESDTGSGKTEAALAHYLRLFHAGEVDGLYFALPTRTAATQLHARLCGILEHAFTDPEQRPPVSLAVPGYIRVDEDEGIALPHFQVLWQDDPRDEKRWRGWSAETPKRFLAGAIVVGTIDQVLLSTLQLGHAHMRYAGLSRMLLVVDEVHASDAYMTRLLEEVLEYHLGVGSHAFLMSATLGQSALADFTGDAPPSLDVATDRSYPQLSRVGRARAGGAEYLSIDPYGYDKEVAIELCELPDDGSESPLHDDTIARLIADAEAGARVLVIRNTVRECVATLAQIEEHLSTRQSADLLLQYDDVVIPHHSRFADADRRRLDQAIEAAMGKNSKRSGVIAVATQTVQQSLDLDADILYSDLCPMDVLLQRVGRLHRHQRRKRPVGFDVPTLVVFTPPSRDLGDAIDPRTGKGFAAHGLGTVYRDLRILDATWSQLETRDSMTIPAQNRVLVEHSLHPEVLEAVVLGGGARWELHEQFIQGDALASAVVADGVILNRKVSYPSRESLFVDEHGDAGRKIRTRLGGDDRLAVFEATHQGPLGEDIRQIKIPEHLCQGVPADATPRDVSVSPGEISFTFGVGSYRYTRYGLEKLQESKDA